MLTCSVPCTLCPSGLQLLAGSAVSWLGASTMEDREGHLAWVIGRTCLGRWRHGKMSRVEFMRTKSRVEGPILRGAENNR